MKRVINTFLRTGYSTTKKFTTADLPYFLKPIAKDCNEGGIASNGNPFWSPENNGNRMKLIHAMLVGTMRPIFQNAQDNRLLRSFKRKARWIIKRQYHQ